MKTITMTSKGQVTIPVEVQRLLGLKPSDKLSVRVDPETREIHLQKPLTVDELATKVHAMKRKNIKPLTDVHEFYARGRTKEIVQKMKENS